MAASITHRTETHELCCEFTVNSENSLCRFAETATVVFSWTNPFERNANMRRIAAGIAALSIAVSGAALASSANAVAQPTKKYTTAQVAKHSSASNCWSIIGSGVYDLTGFVRRHPGGASRIIMLCGKNGTSAFNNQHGGQGYPKSVLSRYKIGTVK